MELGEDTGAMGTMSEGRVGRGSAITRL
ncbi:protein of unknown function (plasmid) [Streptantibioticus cattleyicolor NRRL 8057 = DSM 46488]|nr:protein of unknown function [Streptantibioticus cattleyicolor NRRL 8057 = DSM 46488]